MKINYKILCGATAITLAASFFAAHAQTTADDLQALLQKQLQALGGAAIPLNQFNQSASSTDQINQMNAKLQFMQHLLLEIQTGGGNNINQILQEIQSAKSSGLVSGLESDDVIKAVQQIQDAQQLEQQLLLGGGGNNPLNFAPPSANCPDAKTLKNILPLTENNYQLLMTWKTGGLVPSIFPGKVLPTTGSQISASFEVLRNGKIMNPGGQAVGGKPLGLPVIYWYLNDDLIGNSNGRQTITFTLPSRITAPDNLVLQVQLPQYKEYPLCEQEQEKFFLGQLDIPLVAPEAVIEAPYANGNLFGAAIVKAVPYFFNAVDASKLSYVWNVNGETAPGAEDPTNLIVNVNPEAPSGSTIDIALDIQDPKNPALLPGSGMVSLNYIR